jgi:transposase
MGTVYIGVDFHPHKQMICYVNTADGEIHRKELSHDLQKIRQFYSMFEPEAVVGLEAGCNCQWFEKMLSELGHKLLVGDAKEIRRLAPSRHKTDSRDAEHLLNLLLEGRFPQLWRRSTESETVLGQLRYRHSLVQDRTRICNRLQMLAHRAGLKKSRMQIKATQRRLQQAELSITEQQQREAWFAMLADLNKRIETVQKWLEAKAQSDEQVIRLQTQPGVGPLTALCLVHTLGDVSRFFNMRKVVAYVGFDPVEKSSGEKQRIGHISKAGSRLLRFLLVQAAQASLGSNQRMRQFYQRVSRRRGHAIAKVAGARKLLISSYIMMRDQIDYDQYQRRASQLVCPGSPLGELSNRSVKTNVAE